MSARYLARVLSAIARQCNDPDTVDALDKIIAKLRKRAGTEDAAPAAGERDNDRAVGRPLAGVPTSNQLGPNMENVK